MREKYFKIVKVWIVIIVIQNENVFTKRTNLIVLRYLIQKKTH